MFKILIKTLCTKQVISCNTAGWLAARHTPCSCWSSSATYQYVDIDQQFPRNVTDHGLVPRPTSSASLCEACNGNTTIDLQTERCNNKKTKDYKLLKPPTMVFPGCYYDGCRLAVKQKLGLCSLAHQRAPSRANDKKGNFPSVSECLTTSRVQFMPILKPWPLVWGEDSQADEYSGQGIAKNHIRCLQLSALYGKQSFFANDHPTIIGHIMYYKRSGEKSTMMW
jgi:hypothetical protein